MAKKCILILFCFLFNGFAFAKPIYIQVSGGKSLAVPIAVLPFKQLSGNKLDTNLSDIVSSDLGNSGQFRNLLVPADAPKGSDNVSLSYWRQQGAEYLVSGEIKSAADNIVVVVKLVDLYRTNKIKSQVRFSINKKDNLRTLAHHISDKIFETITAVPGYFATKLAYVTLDDSKVTESNGNFNAANYRLYISDFDGYSVAKVLDVNYPIMSPAWSPDGLKLAFVTFKDQRSNIKVFDLKTGKDKVITNTPGINGAPAWSADGNKLALVLSKDGFPKLYTYDFKTEKLRQVTKGSYIDTEPCWDPSGKSLLFTSNRGGKPQIYRLTLADLKVERITFDGIYNATPRLTADGKTLIMLHKDDEGNFNIGVQAINSTNIINITNSKINESPSIAPNGAMVVYSTRDGDKGTLGLVSIDGKHRMLLPISADIVRHPAWSPFISTNSG